MSRVRISSPAPCGPPSAGLLFWAEPFDLSGPERASEAPRARAGLRPRPGGARAAPWGGLRGRPYRRALPAPRPSEGTRCLLVAYSPVMPTPAARPRRRPLLALVALAAVGWAVMGGAGLGTPPPGGRDPAGLIAFVDGYGQLAVVDVASAAVTAFGPGRAVFPAWSSDGARVAAVVVGQAGVAVEVVDVARGAGPTVVLAAPDRVPIYLYWSPDDRYLAVLSNAPGSTLALDIVDVARALSSDPAARSTLAFGQPFYWVWSPT